MVTAWHNAQACAVLSGLTFLLARSSEAATGCHVPLPPLLLLLPCSRSLGLHSTGITGVTGCMPQAVPWLGGCLRQV